MRTTLITGTLVLMAVAALPFAATQTSSSAQEPAAERAEPNIVLAQSQKKATLEDVLRKLREQGGSLGTVNGEELTIDDVIERLGGTGATGSPQAGSTSSLEVGAEEGEDGSARSAASKPSANTGVKAGTGVRTGTGSTSSPQAGGEVGAEEGEDGDIGTGAEEGEDGVPRELPSTGGGWGAGRR